MQAGQHVLACVKPFLNIYVGERVKDIRQGLGGMPAERQGEILVLASLPNTQVAVIHRSPVEHLLFYHNVHAALLESQERNQLAQSFVSWLALCVNIPAPSNTRPL